MGIISSTFLSLAVQIAWNCQRFLDPRYRSIEPKVSLEDSSGSVSCQFTSSRSSREVNNANEVARQVAVHSITHDNRSHQENESGRVAESRYRKRRRSSFDVALIIRGMNKNGTISSAGHRVISSTPNTLTRQQAPVWNASSTLSSSSTSTSSISSSSSSSSSSSIMSSSEGSDLDVGVKVKKTEKKLDKSVMLPSEYVDDTGEIFGEEHAMTAAEEAAFRMTVARGHFSRSKKDRFLKNLRLEKRLNNLNREFFELTCRVHSRSLHRHHPGDLRKVV